MPKAARLRSRHLFVIGCDGEPLSWSPGAKAAVPASIVALVSGCLVPFVEDQALIGEIVMHLGERFTLYIVRNAAQGPTSYAVIVDEVAEARSI